ncbi:maltokinase [Streptacidiphilus sp. PB12-B1b]|nr:maltokinase [Streptacidiphilus sp. PB12-B1b]
MLCDWLPRQRWFAGKGHPVTAIVPAAITLLPGGRPGDPLLLHLLLRVEQAGQDGTPGSELYQLLLGARPGPAPARLTSDAAQAAVIGRISGGPHDGLLTYDAAYDEVLTLRLLSLLTAQGGRPEQGRTEPENRTEAQGRTEAQERSEAQAPQAAQVGPLRFSSLGGLGEGAGRGLPGPAGGAPARVGTAEQSNTSIVFGDTSILKLFRRVAPGLNPDLELSLALSRAGSTRVPSTLAWFESELPAASEQPDPATGPGSAGQLATLGLLQRFLSGGRDGWEFALGHVRELRADPEKAEQLTGNFSAESFLLGRSTAEIHLALARALPVSVLGRADVEALASSMALRLDAAALVAPALVPYREPLHRIFRALADSAREGRLLRAQRIHGDLHLGQSMRTARGWMLLDFEGEPAKSLAERRRPQPAVRDVAAMLRSFDYAAAHLLTEVAPDDAQRPRLAGLAATWAGRNREAFLAGYAAAGADDPTADPLLLHALETDKAVYEVVYEARNRPDWLPIPLSAIARLARSA